MFTIILIVCQYYNIIYHNKEKRALFMIIKSEILLYTNNKVSNKTTCKTTHYLKMFRIVFWNCGMIFKKELQMFQRLTTMKNAV